MSKMEEDSRRLLVLPWSTLKSILDNKLMATIYIWIFVLPAAFKIFESVPEVVLVGFLSEEQEVSLSTVMPFSWYAVYFSALFFSVARLNYVIFCPDFIRKYESPSSAIADGVTGDKLVDHLCRHIPTEYKSLPPYYSTEGSLIRDILKRIGARWAEIDIKWHEGTFADSSGLLLYDAINSAPRKDHPDDSSRFQMYGYTGGFYDKNEEVDISKEEFVKSVSWSLISLQDQARIRSRFFVQANIALGVILFVTPVFQNFAYVVSTLLI